MPEAIDSLPLSTTVLCVATLVALVTLLFITTMPTFAQFPLEGTRRSQYAGSWYEADPDKLAAQLKSYLSAAKSDLKASKASAGSQVLAIISPHAGYMFSGSTAAYGFESAKKAGVKRIFVLGPSHHVALHGVALPMAVSFETPLGNLEVDNELVEQLKSYPLFSTQPEIHRVEHSLEMQLPFIKETFGDVKIVPIVIGQLRDEAEVRLIAEVLKGYIQKDDLVIVSSDFTHHGPRYGYEPFKDNVRANIEKLDREAFGYLSKADVPGWLDFEARTHATICGFYPTAVLCAMLPHGTRAELLKYSTSQDVAKEETDNSVSYLAVEFTGAPWPENPRKRATAAETIKLSDKEKQTVIEIARKSLELWVKENRVFNAEAAGLTVTPAMRECFGAFVTLYKSPGAGELHTHHGGKQLRGCIGSIWPIKPLWQTITDNAIASASKDHRFHPVAATELPDIEIEISILTPPRRVASYEDIVLGTDGIILSKHDKTAVFLPFVPTEFGWTRDETLRELSLKAGLRQDDWKHDAKFDLFQSLSLEERR